ncbi:MAG: hypothetical protein ACTTH8_06690 [Treponema sp.]
MRKDKNTKDIRVKRFEQHIKTGGLKAASVRRHRRLLVRYIPAVIAGF